MTIAAFILLIAIIGGGIYLWVNWKRKRIVNRHKKLVEDSGLLDPSGNILPDALDKLARGKAKPGEGQTSTDSEASATTRDDSTAPAAGGVQAGTSPDTGSKDGSTVEAAQTTGEANVKAPSNDGAYVTRLRKNAPRIRELTEALLLAWREASLTDQHWESNKSRRNSVGYDLQRAQDLSRIKVTADIQPFFQRMVETQVVLDQLSVTAGELLSNLLPRAREAKAAWQALVDGLRSFPDEDDLTDLPADLQAILLTAHQVRSVSKSSIENLLSEGAQAIERNASLLADHTSSGAKVQKKAALAKSSANASGKAVGKTPSATDASGKANADAADSAALETAAEKERLRLLENARQNIARCVEQLLSAVLTSRASYMELHGLRESLKASEARDITKPRKPTPEEVTRYLSEVEDKANTRMLTGRLIVAGAASLEETLKQVSSAREALTTALNREAASLRESGDDKLVATVTSAETVQSMGGESSKSMARMVSDVRSAGHDSTTAVAAHSAEEDALDRDLRQLTRTLGFAVAQHVVAVNKLRSVRNSEPSEPGKARVDREQDFAANLARIESYLARLDQFHTDWDRFSKETEVVEVALQARLLKIKETTKALEAKTTAVSRGLKADSSDLLRVSAATAQDLVILMGEYTKDSH